MENKRPLTSEEISAIVDGKRYETSMNKTTISRERNETIAEQKLFGISRDLAGALLGILLFLTVVATFWSIKLMTAFLILLSPGILTAWLIIPRSIAWSTSIPSMILNYSIILGVSIIPPAILGSVIISKDKTTKVKGIALLAIYLIVLVTIGLPISTLFD